MPARHRRRGPLPGRGGLPGGHSRTIIRADGHHPMTSRVNRPLAEYVAYANGPATTVWGESAANGHAEPCRVKYGNIGNEMWGPPGSTATCRSRSTRQSTTSHVRTQSKETAR